MVFVVMETWKDGREILRKKMLIVTPHLKTFKEILEIDQPRRVKGIAVFMTRSHDVVPAALMHNLRHNNVLHSTVVLLNIPTEEVPRVPKEQKIEVETLGEGLYSIVARYGFMGQPDVGEIFALSNQRGMTLNLKDASFFLGREKLGISDSPGMSRWRSNLFVFLSKNSMDASAYFGIPSNRAIEVGSDSICRPGLTQRMPES